MKRLALVNFLLFVSVILLHAQTDLTKYVDPWIGTDGGGNTFPGSCVPFGMVKAGPVCGQKNRNSGWDKDGNIHGFSHVNLSGLGGGCKYGNVLFAPVVGEINIQDYSSPRRNEKAELGIYEVELQKYNTSARLTALNRSTMHEYSFPEGTESKILVDLGTFLASLASVNEQQIFVGSEVRIISDHEMEGYTRIRNGWNKGNAYTVYFYAVFDTPAADYGTWKGDKMMPGVKEQFDTNEKTGAYFTYHTKDKQSIKFKVGISYLSVGKAKANLSEMTTWNFDEVKEQCVAVWNKLLNKVHLKGSEENKKIFYTALYHSHMQPADKIGENSKWQSDQPYYDDFYAIWDTFRASHPLFTLLTPSIQADMLRSLLDIYRYDGYMPDARSGDDNGRVQGGSNCDILFADAIRKGIRGIDYQLALEAMIKNAEVPPGGNEQKQGRGGIPDYNTKGYVSTKYERSASRTMEYGNCDYAIYTVASELSQPEIAKKYLNRSKNWQNLWNPDIESLGFKGFVWPRREDGSWLSESEFSVFKNGTWPDIFYETYSWEMSFYAPHDINKLIELCGGKDTFIDRLDTFFSYQRSNRRGYIGLFQISNEPSFLIPCLYNYAGRPDKTAEITRRALREQYNTTRTGLPGNDDSGSMSAWYIFHALGFFPNAGQDIYLFSSPIFEEATIFFENKNKLEIRAKNASEANIYIQSVKLNEKPINVNFIKHSDLISGGTLEFVMGPKPSKWGNNEIR